MEGNPTNTGDNAERKSTEEAQQECAVQVSERTHGTSVTSDDRDKIFMFISAGLAGCAYVAKELGHSGVSEFFVFLTALGVLVTFVAFLNERHWLPYGIAQHPWRFCVGASLLLLVLWCFLQLHLSRQNLLRPGDGWTPRIAYVPTGINRVPSSDPWPVPKEAFKLFFGNSITAWTNSFPVKVFSQYGDDIIFVEKKGNSIFLSAQFFNSEGKIICKIDKNEITLSDNNVFGVDRDLSHKLAVTSDEHRLFQIEFINESSIRLLGDFYMRDGVHIVVKENESDFGGTKFTTITTGLVKLKHRQPFCSVERDDTGHISTVINNLHMLIGGGMESR